MTVRDLDALFAYDRWASARVFEVVDALTPEAFARPVVGGRGSVRATLVHVLSATWGWLERCGGPPRGDRLTPDRYPTPSSLRSDWTRVEGLMQVFLAELHDEDLDRLVRYPGAQQVPRTMPLGDLLHHTATHAVHHRGQVATMLRELGHAIGPFDLLFYYAAVRGVEAW